MNWFLCVLGLLGIATVVCLCLHQYHTGGDGHDAEETFADHTPPSKVDGAELVVTGPVTNFEDLLASPSRPPPPPVGEEVVAKEEEHSAEAEEEAGYAAEEEEGASYAAAAEEAATASTRRRTSKSVSPAAAAAPAPAPAEEETTTDVIGVIDGLGDNLAASTATSAEEEAVAEEEQRKAAAATTAKRTPPVQAVLQVIDVPPPEEETRVVPAEEEETAPAAEEASAPTAEAASYQDETYAYHPSPKDEVVEVDEPGYVYLPSRFWSVPQQRPPACTPATKPKVCPIFTDGVPEGALEWRSTVRERQLRAAVRPAHARHRRDPKLDYYYPGYYAKGDAYKHKCA